MLASTKRELIRVVDLPHNIVRVKPRVARAGVKKAHVGLRVELMGRTGGYDHRLVFRIGAISGRVAESAVERHAVEPDRLFREPDRHLVPLFPDQAERCVTARTRQLFRENPRQHKPDPVRYAVVSARCLSCRI